MENDVTIDKEPEMTMVMDGAIRISAVPTKKVYIVYRRRRR